jgi:AraC-like DNA-binding protein
VLPVLLKLARKRERGDGLGAGLHHPGDRGVNLVLVPRSAGVDHREHLGSRRYASTGWGRWRTKALILDRVMLEATRLLRFTNSTVSQIAYLCGYTDPLYFSRAFKRHQGRSPAHYGASIRGATLPISSAG